MLVGISVYGRWNNRAFADDRNLSSPLLSDFESKGEGAKKYGGFDPQAGLCERASNPKGSFGGVTSLHQASIRELIAFYLH
jgi:peroxiredoxin